MYTHRILSMVPKKNTTAKAELLKKIHKQRQPKIRVPIVPPFGPTGCDITQWQSYASQIRAHFESGGLERDIPGGVVSWADSPVPSQPKRNLNFLLAALNHSNTRVLNVQEPWATMIATSRKDFENRPDKFPQGGGWMVIVASKVKYSAPEWTYRLGDIRRRLAWSGVDDSCVFTQKDLQETEQCAIAVAKVVSVDNRLCSLELKQSIWNNGDAFAWKIVEVHKLIEPVFFGNGTLGKPYFKNCPSAFKDNVRHQISRLAV